ncbi:MAG: hypothetical protein Q7S21_03795 [archaeon]|nr:hypothetical protein [archaeon]
MAVDTFSLVVTLLMLMLAVQYGEGWLVFGIAAIMIIALRSLSATLMIIAGTVLLYVFKGSGLNDLWPIIVIALIIIALISGLGKKEEPAYGGGDLSSLLGGGGGGEYG